MQERDRALMAAAAKAGSNTLLVNVIAKRIRQLHRGSKPLLEHVEGMSALDVALREFNEDRIGFRVRGEG